jgi:hypothetical protein
MKFRSNAVQGITVYDLVDIGNNKFRWTELTNEYVNAGDIIDVNFDVVIESYFTVDVLNGMFTAVDEEAQAWIAPLKEFSAEVA